MFLFLSGLLAGLGSLFRFDFGGVLVAAQLVTIGYSVFGPESLDGSSGSKKHLLEKLYRPVAMYLSGVLVVLLPVFFYYALNGSLGRLYHDTVYFPSQNYVNTRSLPWVGVDRLEGLMGFRDFMVYYPMIAVVISALLRSEKIPRELRTFALLFVCLIVPLTIKGSVRVSVIHMQPAIVLAFGLMAPFWGLLFKSERRSFKLSGILASVIVLAASCDLLLNRIFETRFPVLRDISGFFTAWHEKKFLGSVPEHSSAMFLVGSLRYEAIAILDRCADQNDTVFLGRGRHDQLVLNDVLSYFLLGRKPATKWYHFDPGLQTSRRIQEEMIADLTHNKPEYLWLDSTGDGYYEPNDSRLSSGVTSLDQFIRDRYWPLAQVGVIEIMRRRDVVPGFGCPI